MEDPIQMSTPLKWTGALVAKFWDFYALHRSQLYFTHLFGQQIVKITERFLPKDAVVCDFGCGAGFLCEQLATRFACAGVDFSPRNVEATNLRLAGSPNFHGALLARDAQASGKKFGAVYIVETVEHLLDEEVIATMKLVHGSLHPNGVVIVTTPNAETLEDSEVYCPSCDHTFHQWQHVRQFDAESLAGFMSTAGFEKVQTFVTDFSIDSEIVLALKRIFSSRRMPHLVYIGRRVEARSASY